MILGCSVPGTITTTTTTIPTVSAVITISVLIMRQQGQH